MKNIIIAFFLMLAPVGVTAQYQKAQEKAPLVNVPLENFASQQKVLFNFGWKFQLVTNENKNTDFASPVLDDSSWRTLDLPHDFQFEQPWTEKIRGLFWRILLQNWKFYTERVSIQNRYKKDV